MHTTTHGWRLDLAGGSTRLARGRALVACVVPIDWAAPMKRRSSPTSNTTAEGTRREKPAWRPPSPRLGQNRLVPTGLDGNPDPVASTARDHVLWTVASRIAGFTDLRVLVAVDGRSGVGKSTFADELAGALRSTGVPVVRSTTDSFHRARDQRMRLGPTSPEGYYLDSHQITTITDELLGPFQRGAPSVMTSAFDEPSDSPKVETTDVGERCVLIFDGLFVHRPELRSHWNLTVMLEADRRCDERWLNYLEAGLPTDPTPRAAELDKRLERARWPRYRHGWQNYIDSIDPASIDILIDNEDFATPSILVQNPS